MRHYLLFIIFALSTGLLSAQNDNVYRLGIDTNHYAATYLSITTSPYTLPKGALNYQNLYVGYNGLEWGVTNRFSLSGGLSLFRFETSGTTFFLFGKYNLFRNKTTSISLSNLNIFYPLNDRERGIVSVLFANGAVGDKNQFISLGAGYGLDFNSEEPVLIFTVGYHNRFSDIAGLLVDVWLAVVDVESRGIGIPLPSIGIRFFLDNDITVDLGLPVFGFKVPIRKVEQKSRHRNFN